MRDVVKLVDLIYLVDKLNYVLQALRPPSTLHLRRSDYTEADLLLWLDRILAQDWERAFVLFKHEEEAKGPELAKRFLKLADARMG